LNSDQQNIDLGIFADPSAKDKPFVWKGRTYNFKVKELTWAASEKIMSNCGTASKGGVIKVDMFKYSKEIMLATIVDTDGLFSVDEMTILKLNEGFVRELEAQGIVESPSGGLSEEDEKN